ncbi:MAG: right-handed parallel beta-helix repeat-containing protein [Pseudobdellovibrio sp.]
MKKQNHSGVRFVFFLFVLFNLCSLKSFSREIVVESGSDLTAVLNAAVDGDSILVKTGQYTMGLMNLHTNIEIKGESRDSVTLIGTKLPALRFSGGKVKISQLSFKADPQFEYGGELFQTDGGTDVEAENLGFDCSNTKHMGLGFYEPSQVKVKNVAVKNCFNGLSVFKMKSGEAELSDLKFENITGIALQLSTTNKVIAKKIRITKSLSGIQFYESKGSIEDVKITESKPTAVGISILIKSEASLNDIDIQKASGGLSVEFNSKCNARDVRISDIESMGILTSDHSNVEINNLYLDRAKIGLSLHGDSKVNINRGSINKTETGVALGDVEFDMSNLKIYDAESGILQSNARSKLYNIQMDKVEKGFSCTTNCGSLNASGITITNSKDPWYAIDSVGLKYTGSGNSPEPSQLLRSRYPASH